MTRTVEATRPRADGALRRKPTGRPTLATVVTDQVRARIVDGSYPPGTPLNEVELATRFATSRGPIREGLRRLVEDGLLIAEPHRGIRVREFTADDIEDLYFARSAIERAAMERVLERGPSASLLADLHHELAKMAHALETEDAVAVATVDLTFHSLIVQAARSQRLAKMQAILACQTRLGLHQLVPDYHGSSGLINELRDLMRCLADQDSTRLNAVLARHFTHGMRLVQEQDR